MIQKNKTALFATGIAALALSAFASCGTSSASAVEPASSASNKTAEAPNKSDTMLASTSDDEKTSALDPIAKIKEFITSKNIDTTKSSWKTRLPKPPKLKFVEDQDILWHLDTTEGDITIKLMPSVAPMHVSSTIYLTELGFYDDLKFHRVIKGFMAQGGCPLGRGTGNPGYKYNGEFDPKVKHDRPGLLSMANAGRGTDGSQFFLTFVPTPHLDGKHTIFGEVTEGMDTLKKLESFGSRSGTTSKKLIINKATIEVKPSEAK